MTASQVRASEGGWSYLEVDITIAAATVFPDTNGQGGVVATLGLSDFREGRNVLFGGIEQSGANSAAIFSVQIRSADDATVLRTYVVPASSTDFNRPTAGNGIRINGGFGVRCTGAGTGKVWVLYKLLG